MNWTDYITLELRQPDATTKYSFHVPATENALAALKETLGLKALPQDLEELYRQTDGIDELIDEHKIGEIIWPVNRVIETNKAYRSNRDFKELYMPFDQLLFFSDAGNGDLFGFEANNGAFRQSGVFAWNHEDDSRTWVAPDLKQFITGWINGTITT